MDKTNGDHFALLVEQSAALHQVGTTNEFADEFQPRVNIIHSLPRLSQNYFAKPVQSNLD